MTYENAIEPVYEKTDVRQNIGRMSHSPKGGSNNTYLTPKSLLEHVYRCLGYVTLDPCSNSFDYPQVIAQRYYIENDDGLALPWYGHIFCNPPYRVVGAWVAKFLREYRERRMDQGMLLVAASTETRWFQQLGESDALICFLKQRLWFDEAPGVPCKERARFPSVLVYLGGQQDTFREVFASQGCIR